MTILIWDSGNLCELARRMGEDEEVIYFNEWSNDNPKFYHYGIGMGFENVKKVKQFHAYIDDADLIAYFDIGHGTEADRLREEGYSVFGSGLGEKLELNRLFAKQIQKQIGLPVQPFKVIKGVEAVIEYVKKNPEKYIKISTFRGDMESFFALDWETAKNQLTKFATKVGPFADSFEFMVEDKVDAVCETGFDTWFNGNEFLKPYLWGYIIGDAYYGRWCEKLPGTLELVANKIIPVLKKFNVRGTVSVEVMATKDNKPYILDWTMRIPRPLGLIYSTLDNFTEVVEATANGENIEIEPPDEYCGMYPYFSAETITDWMKVSYPQNMSDSIKGLSIAKVKDDVYAAPQNPWPVAAIGWGSKIEEVYDEIDKYGKEISAYEISIEDCNRKKADKIIKDGRTVGLDF